MISDLVKLCGHLSITKWQMWGINLLKDILLLLWKKNCNLNKSDSGHDLVRCTILKLKSCKVLIHLPLIP
jgi:hypothetical protein